MSVRNGVEEPKKKLTMRPLHVAVCLALAIEPRGMGTAGVGHGSVDG